MCFLVLAAEIHRLGRELTDSKTTVVLIESDEVENWACHLPAAWAIRRFLTGRVAGVWGTTERPLWRLSKSRVVSQGRRHDYVR